MLLMLRKHPSVKLMKRKMIPKFTRKKIEDRRTMMNIPDLGMVPGQIVFGTALGGAMMIPTGAEMEMGF